MEYPHFTIILQGPLHKIGLSRVSYYAQFCNVIVSSWSYCDLKLLDILNINKKNVKVILNHDVNVDNVDNDGNVYRQTITTLNGLLNTETKYAIKMRCDESYSNIDYLISTIQMFNGEKIVYADRYARSYRLCNSTPYHIGDTFFGGSTHTLGKAFLFLKHMLEHRGISNLSVNGKETLLSTEQKMGISMIRTYEPNFEFDEFVYIMKKYFWICPVSALAPFLINSSGWKTPLTKWDASENVCITHIGCI